MFFQDSTALIRYCFRSSRVHEFNIVRDTLAIRPQGCEKVYMLTLEKTDGTMPSMFIENLKELKQSQLVVKLLGSHSTGSTELQRHDLASLLPPLPRRFSLSWSHSNSFSGQTASSFHDHRSKQQISFSLSECGLITTHRILSQNDMIDESPIYVSQGMMYIRRSPDGAPSKWGGQISVASGSMISSMPPRTAGYDLKPSPPKCSRGFGRPGFNFVNDVCYIKGDDQFLVLTMSDGVRIWGFDEAWRPSDALSEAGLVFQTDWCRETTDQFDENDSESTE